MMNRLPHGVCVPPICPGGISHKPRLWRTVALPSSQIPPEGAKEGVMYRTCVCLAAAALLGCSSEARAEPITLTYLIHVTETCSGESCSPTSIKFPLVVSFDSGVTQSMDSPDRVFRQYGAPSFSPIPLVRPDVFPLAVSDAYTVDLAQLTSDGWQRQGGLSTASTGFAGGLTYRWFLGIGRFFQGDSSTPPFEVNPSSFVAFLNEGQFGYGLHILDETDDNLPLDPRSARYVGSAALQDPTPVPEPMSLLLVGSGLCAIGTRNWRLRSKPRNHGSRQSRPRASPDLESAARR
jgi:hypothetical protein